MTKICPVCFQPDQDTICTHCGTNIDRILKVRLLENIADQRNTLPTLLEILRQYREMGRPQAAARIMTRMANYYIKVGRWREARLYLEQILALGTESGSPVFRASVRRSLGGLLGRQGEMPLALHLLNDAEQHGDPLALIEKLRLEMDTHSKVNVLLNLSQLGNPENLPRVVWAWRMEASVRYTGSPDVVELLALVQDAEDAGDAYSEAIARRALALWQVNHAQSPAAVSNLRESIKLFLRESDLYETARTQVDLARACLLMDTGTFIEDSTANANITAIDMAQRYLGSAKTLFHKLGASMMEDSAEEILRSLAIGRQTAPLKKDATSAGVVLLWLATEGHWDDQFWVQATAVVQQQGGLVERMLGGMVVIMGEEQHYGDVRLAIETALALNELIAHYSAYNLLDSSSRYRIAISQGMLPLESADVTDTLRSLPRTRIFRETRAQAARLDPGTVCVNDMLYLNTREHYLYSSVEVLSETNKLATDTFTAIPPNIDDTNPIKIVDKDPRWWMLQVPQHAAVSIPVLQRYELKGCDAVLPLIDLTLDKFKQQQLGGVVAITGAQGSGKTRLLNTLIGELQKSMKLWIIHLRGRDAMQHQPFGIIQHWLGNSRENDTRPPEERRQDTIAGFRRSVTGLLKSKPLLLVIDDAHLMDSGSLATLQAVLPLTASHKLLIMVTARPDGATLDSMIALSSRALPERTVRVQLPAAYQPRDLPEDLTTRHVLACAAVLGDRFSTVTLRRMSGVAVLTPHLKTLQIENYIIPTARSLTWQFRQTAERDYIYENLAPDYRAVLHWYARQSLKVLGMFPDEHIHPAGLPEPAMKISIRAAQQALEMDSPAEALYFFDRALSHYKGDGLPVDLLLGRAGVLLSLEDWGAVQEVITTLQQFADLSLRDQATLLIYQGELNYRVGEVAMLFRLYQQAAEKLRSLPPEESDISEQIGILYAQALARFKRGELEIARSLIGTALHTAQQAGLEQELAHLWELLARIHHMRGEAEPALKAVNHALESHRASGYRWSLLDPLERAGSILIDSGETEKGSKHIVEALTLADELGHYERLVRLHRLMARIATYRGEWDAMQTHLEAALNHARYVEDIVTLAKAHADYAEGLVLLGKPIQAMQQATQAVLLADRNDNPEIHLDAYLAVAIVSMALNYPEDAAEALEKARIAARTLEDPHLLLGVEKVGMEIAALKEDPQAFDTAWYAIRDIPIRAEHEFLRARIDMVRSQYFIAKKSWNEAAREAEHASRIFHKIGATHWDQIAETQLRSILPYLTGQHLKPRTHVRQGK